MGYNKIVVREEENFPPTKNRVATDAEAERQRKRDNKMYLIVKCEEFSNQWECDADRCPLCLVEDCSKYGMGYEVYKVLKDGTFQKVKDYDDALEEGIAVYFWQDSEDEEEDEPTICEKWKNMERDAMTKSKIQTLKNKYGFDDTVKEILSNIHCTGAHGESINDKWYVIGEYRDNIYDRGY